MTNETSDAAVAIAERPKAIDKSMEIGEIYLVKKTGGKSGTVENRPRALRNGKRELDIL